MVNINQEKLTRDFANELIQSIINVRELQKAYFRIKAKRLKPNDPILVKALKDSIMAENQLDAMIQEVTVKKIGKQYSLDDQE